MKLANDALALDPAIANAIYASLITNLRIPKAITYQRYTRVKPRTVAFRRSDIPQCITYHEFEPLNDEYDEQLPQPNFQAYQADLHNIEQNHNTATPFYVESNQLLFDTGASISCTSYKHDFIGPIRPVQNTSISGIAADLTVEGIGTVGYSLPTTDGSSIYVQLDNFLYVPKCPTCLICPRQLLLHLEDPKAEIQVTTNALTLSFRGRQILIPYDARLNIPILRTAPGLTGYLSFCQATNSSPTAHPPPLLSFNATTDDNLTPAQHTKRKWHLRLNHAHYRQINQWITDGLLPCDPSVARAPDPICPVCQYGKGKRRSHHATDRPIRHAESTPGQSISANQMEAATPGLMPTNAGKPTQRRYLYANFWIDHHSSFIYVTMHETKEAVDLVKSKCEFETFAAKYNVRIQSIRADNGVYSAAAFRISCDTNLQKLTFCAVGSHWQNGIAERAIGTVQCTARTILLHAMANWPSTINESFWPFAIRHAIHLHNCSIRRDHHISPWELFTNEQPPFSLDDFRVLGSPVYILQKALQDGNSVPKWTPRSWQGVYVGFSPLHAGKVSLVYNPKTTHVSPQYHLVFDEYFSSVTGPPKQSIDTFLQKLCDSATWLSSSSVSGPTPDNEPSEYHFDSFWSDSTLPPPMHSTGTRKRPAPHPPDNGASNNHTSNLPSNPTIQYSTLTGSSDFQAWKRRKDINGNVLYCAKFHRNPSSNPSTAPSPSPLPALACIFQAALDHGISDLPTIPTSEGAYEGGSNPDIFLSLQAALLSTEDVLTQSQMLKAEDKELFLNAQVPEIRGLEKLNVFQYSHIKNLPNGAHLLNAIWSYHRKRRPTGELLKNKARICTDGSQQQFGVDYWQTYAPVVNWSTVRLVLVLASIMNFSSRQVDFAQAFPQAPLEDPVYMKIPQGWYIDDNNNLQKHDDPKFKDTQHFIKLLRNLYGCKQGARNWWQHLSKGLIARGFRPSSTDNCLYIRHDCILVIYTDDCLLFAKDSSTIDNLIADLTKDYLIGDTGSVQDFLGIRITKDSAGRTHMIQTGLIDAILRDLNITDCKTKYTPADQVLHPDTNGPPRRETWNYRSVIGKLNFLAQNTRPDISMAVHNCARFCTNPTQLHESAVKCIGRYLLLTRDKGLILSPQADYRLNMYVDADFAGAWHKEFAQLRESVLSRTGFLITYCGCPVTWCSKLQSEIALSTTKAEYIALSMATRHLLPLRCIMADITEYGPIHVTLHQNSPIHTHTSSFTSSAPSSNNKIPPSIIFEDNASCIVLAQTDHHKLRTKHISIKWHHFRDQIQNGSIIISKIDTTNNLADILTKPLVRSKHEHLRKPIMGW